MINENDQTMEFSPLVPRRQYCNSEQTIRIFWGNEDISKEKCFQRNNFHILLQN